MKFDFFLPYFLLFAACLPIDFFQIEHLQVPFLRRFLVKKVNVLWYFPLIDIYLTPFRQPLIFRVQECRADKKNLHVYIEVNVEDLICKTVQGQSKPISLNCCGAFCLIQKPFPLMRVINTEAALL